MHVREIISDSEDSEIDNSEEEWRRDVEGRKNSKRGLKYCLSGCYWTHLTLLLCSSLSNSSDVPG